MSNPNQRLAVIDPSQAAEAVVFGLPQPDYTTNYQPTYPDQAALMEGVRELHNTTPVTKPEHIDHLGSVLRRIAEGASDRPVLIVGGCHEEVSVSTPVSELVAQAYSSMDLVAHSALRHAVILQRNRGQNAKPRSNEVEVLDDGTEVASYMGDSINGYAATERTPDPTRMVAAAVQARDLEAGLSTVAGRHVPAAHEALLLPYELSFLRSTDEGDYLLSTDMPWVGKRTNAADGEHVELLGGINNPVGAKIGPDSTPEHVIDLCDALNPDMQPGKLTLMFRLGIANLHHLPPILRAVRDHGSQPILMVDIHGTTRTMPGGRKLRLVGDIIRETQAVAALCQAEGMRLHGAHLETMTNNDRLECVDNLDQTPDKPIVDPQLNPRQTRRVLNAIAPHLALQAA